MEKLQVVTPGLESLDSPERERKKTVMERLNAMEILADLLRENVFYICFFSSGGDGMKMQAMEKQQQSHLSAS